MGGVVLSLEGKVALVTGGSRGIGAATVRMMRAAGARVVFSYERAREAAEALVAELGGEELCRAVQQELSTAEHGRALVAAAVEAFGRVDCLVVNHGIWPAHEQPIGSMTDAQWERTMAVNLHSVFGLVRAGVAQMLEQDLSAQLSPTGNDHGSGISDRDGDAGDGVAGICGGPSQVSEARPGAPKGMSEISEARPGAPNGGGESSQVSGARPGAPKGHVVLIASTAAQRGEAFHADYAASKGALVSLTKSLSSELAGKGIYVNCVAPGWVGTEMSMAALSDPETSKKATALIPLGRVGHVDEIAGPVVFLCTPLAGFVSGEIFNVNGGAVLVG